MSVFDTLRSNSRPDLWRRETVKILVGEWTTHLHTVSLSLAMCFPRFIGINCSLDCQHSSNNLPSIVGSGTWCEMIGLKYVGGGFHLLRSPSVQ